MKPRYLELTCEELLKALLALEADKLVELLGRLGDERCLDCGSELTLEGFGYRRICYCQNDE